MSQLITYRLESEVQYVPVHTGMCYVAAACWGGLWSIMTMCRTSVQSHFVKTMMKSIFAYFPINGLKLGKVLSHTDPGYFKLQTDRLNHYASCTG